MGEAGSETERRINAFAVHLLLPRSSLTTAWNASSEGIRTRAIRLAAEYRVSWSALCAQLKNLGLVREPERQMLLEQRPLPSDSSNGRGRTDCCRRTSDGRLRLWLGWFV
ncbi:hypothetical protein Plo01_44560 [Planobispora longispora]|uniref:IrrE N-terminal-like domain-containing protein n=2 Tax=Planobispora longispora TaxID=28887 RepID=A0A8J3RQG2_9ACTN|nr:hypothetical protein Plo01_44560 [Planobispora longispora]